MREAKFHTELGDRYKGDAGDIWTGCVTEDSRLLVVDLLWKKRKLATYLLPIHRKRSKVTTLILIRLLWRLAKEKFLFISGSEECSLSSNRH
jgi:hypothetical protein